MSMGNPTDLGILRYLTTTARTTFAAMLNQGIDAINTYLRDTMRAGDTGWQTPTLSNSWTSVAGQTIQYRRLNGVVYLRGRASGGTTGAIFTLPVGFRPTNSFVVAVGDGTSTAITVTRIVVNTDGTVTGVTGTLPNLPNVPPFPAS